MSISQLQNSYPQFLKEGSAGTMVKDFFSALFRGAPAVAQKVAPAAAAVSGGVNRAAGAIKSKKKWTDTLLAQIEGLYKFKTPESVAGEVVPGLSRQTLPQALHQLATHPITAIKESWRGMGPTKGPIVGIEKRPDKWRPSFARDPSKPASALYPTASRVMTAGFTAGSGIGAINAPKEEKAQRIGGFLGMLPGNLVSGRLNLVPGMALFLGGEAIGSQLGKAVDKLRKSKTPEL